MPLLITHKFLLPGPLPALPGAIPGPLPGPIPGSLPGPIPGALPGTPPGALPDPLPDPSLDYSFFAPRCHIIRIYIHSLTQVFTYKVSDSGSRTLLGAFFGHSTFLLYNS